MSCKKETKNVRTIKKEVYEANMELPKRGLITYTWGNVSGIDRESGLFVIKPSGVDYDKLSPEDMVVMDLDGNRVEGDLNPSSDTPTHIELYKAFKDLGGIVHTHSPMGNIMGTGGEKYSMLWNNTCRLLLWRNSMCKKPHKRRN